MGRIDEALRRTGGNQPAEEQTRAVANPNVFESPWSFDETGTHRAVTPPAAEVGGPPTEIPPRVPAARPSGDNILAPEAQMAVFHGFRKDFLDRLVIGSTISPYMAEQYRRLAATLHHAQLVQGLKTILVTSAHAGDGKSLTATNLALTLSESYRREVLLIDADLRRPSLHEIFDVPNIAGLNEGLKTEGDGRLSVLKVSDTLTLLPAGRPEPDPMGGLTSSRMRRIIEEAGSRFDWVIIDTAPVGLLADANILGAMADGALIVIRAAKTPYAEVTKAIDALGRERVLGVVLNGTDTPPKNEAEYRYYASNRKPEQG
jgi:capsular exopolysaccharide synthesis family protein